MAGLLASELDFSVGDLLYSAQHYSISYTCCRYLEKEWRFLSVAWPCLLNDIRKEAVQVHTYIQFNSAAK
jgi:hypothetical protein